MVEYDPAQVDRFIEIADAVEDVFPGVLVEGVEVEGRPGACDILLEDGTLVVGTASGGAVGDLDAVVSRLSQAGVRPAAL